MALAKTNRRLSLSWIRSHKFLSFIALITFMVIGFFVYERVTLELNKRAFAQARKVIDNVYADIANEVGQPDNYRRTSECSHSYFGPYVKQISCGVDTDLVYNVEDRNEAGQITATVQNIVKRHKNSLTSTTYNSDVFSESERAPGDPNINSHIDYYESSGGLFCVFKYVFDSPAETFLKLPEGTTGKTYYLTMGCNGSARQYYYPPFKQT